jgi:hypothetical protein
MRIRLLLVFVLAITGLATAPSAPDTSAIQQFALPHSHSLDPGKPITCSAIASANLAVAAEQHDKLTASVQGAREKLHLQVDGDTLFVLTSPVEKNAVAIADYYRITAQTPAWLAATVLHNDEMPRGYFIVVNKQNGFAIWSVTEPKYYPQSEYPYAETVYLTCKN